MAEDHGFQAPEGHILCANNCGFFGCPATSNLCSKCYRDLRMKEEQGAIAKAALENNKSSLPSPSTPPSSSAKLATASGIPIPSFNLPESALDQAVVFQPQPSPAAAPVVQPNRCLTCRKRVGLTGFKCRCGSMFCGSHRYPEQHGCTFDYKKMGKEAIAKANPIVKADKLDKI
uniref:SAP4 n=1 Tax=Tamarix hispida TaxID=189793 RepID=A0A8F8T2W3_9CARY|nr:SAP4 [Tamarix hispida]